MDREVLLETAPLVQNRLRDQREKICRGYVEWAIFEKGVSEQFTIEEVSSLVFENTEIEFEDIQIRSALDEICSEGNVNRINKSEYELSSQKDIDSVDSLIEDCWEDFKQILDEHKRDIDVYAIDTNIEDGFRDFINRYIDEIEEETEILEEAHHDVIYNAKIDDLIEDVSKYNNIDKDDEFEECLIDFLNNPTENLKELVGVIYVAIVNSDLLSRQKSVELPDVPEEQKAIFFDSNVIQDLLCQTDSENALVESVVEKSRDLGFDLHYYPETVEDLQSSIDGASREMDGLQDGRYSKQTFNNQFVKDWNEKSKSESVSWGEYFSEIQNWELNVEARYGIERYEEEIGIPEEELEYAKNIIDRIDSERGGRPKRPEVLNHDAKILAKTAHLRKNVEERYSIGPVLLSLDNVVTQASDKANTDGDWSEGISVPPRTWFNYLLTFSSAEFDTIDIGGTILEVSANIESQPSVEEYSKALEEKAGLEGGADSLAKYLRYSTYSDEIERSLRNNDGNADDWAFRALTDEETMEEFTKHKNQQERIRKMGEEIRELREENSQLKQDRDSNNNTNSNNNIVNVSPEVSGGDATASSQSEASASAKAESTASIEQDIEDFVEIYENQLPEDIRENTPDPPEDTSDFERVKDWISVVTGAITMFEPSAATATAGLKLGENIVKRLK